MSPPANLSPAGFSEIGSGSRSATHTLGRMPCGVGALGASTDNRGVGADAASEDRVGRVRAGHGVGDRCLLASGENDVLHSRSQGCNVQTAESG
jgi:hypothetical protein